MKIIQLNDNNYQYIDNLTLTIGNFDGVHLGHQKLIMLIKNYLDTKSAVLTLDPHPSQVFINQEFKTMMTVKTKIKKIEELEIDYLIIAKFDQNFYNQSVPEFINNLQKMGVKRLVLGRDFRFAKNGSGSVADLKEVFEVVVIEDIIDKNIRISSTVIRNLLLDGNIKKANEMLGYAFTVDGKVEHGNKIGKTLGFPTANINYQNAFLPANGVYLVKVFINTSTYYGMCNIGNNPTVNYSELKKMEVFIFDYDDEIYNEELSVSFIEKIRDEKKFESKDALINQIKNDEIKIRSIVKNLNNMLK